jgi:hypothetical protein
MAAYLAGEIDILGGGGSAGPNAYLRGQRDLVFFGAMNNKFVFPSMLIQRYRPLRQCATSVSASPASAELWILPRGIFYD